VIALLGTVLGGCGDRAVEVGECEFFGDGGVDAWCWREGEGAVGFVGGVGE